jgi:hypothetical protein
MATAVTTREGRPKARSGAVGFMDAPVPAPSAANPSAEDAGSPIKRRRIGKYEAPGGEVLRCDSDRAGAILELLRVMARDALELDLQDARLRPFPVPTERQVSHYRRERRRPRVLGQRVVIERTRRGDGLRVPGGALPWAPRFMAIYDAAMAETPVNTEIGCNRTVPGTINAAIVSYYQSTAFTCGLAKSTQDSRRAILEKFRNEHGDKRAALIHAQALQNMLNSKGAIVQRNWAKALAALSITA